MQSFSTFYIERVDIDPDGRQVSFVYSFDEKEYFMERIIFPLAIDDIDTGILSHVAIVFGMSYFKLAPTKNIVVKTTHLDEKQIKFWEKLYRLGLGEFYYSNNLHPRDYGSFSSGSDNVTRPSIKELEEKAIIPIGGGKDSDVTIERVKKLGILSELFTFGSKDQEVFVQTQKIADLPRTHVTRIIDPKLMEWNALGYYNGHVPITAMISFLLVAYADLTSAKYIVFSNESSANTGNTSIDDIDINHQYSKSLEFENDFRDYIRSCLSAQCEYFSLLRDMSEYAIVREFATLEKYHEAFTSCNRNFSITKSANKRWCLECPKCAFVYSLFHPLLSQDKRLQIFGGDMYEDESKYGLFLELLGEEGFKPFECVGEPDEVHASMCASVGGSSADLAPIPDRLVREGKIHLNTFEHQDRELLERSSDHNIPSLFTGIHTS